MMPLDLEVKEETLNPTKADDLNKHNQNLSRLLREQQFFQTQGNDYMVDKLQEKIEKCIEIAKNEKIIL